MKLKTLFFLLLSIILLSDCKRQPQPSLVEWQAADPIRQRLTSAVIYEVNIRQITPEGTFKAFTEQHIDRLRNLGVDILWLMPIHPISVKNRKGVLGSYYSVADYKGVNPEFGTPADLKELINRVHEAGMLVILDWVANHTGWDNPWIKEHPERYTRNEKGEIVPPVPDWSDVADLNYDNPGLKAAMIDAMEYWIREFDIDGYRCDAAAMAPVDFWRDALINLDSIKPVIKLAEAWEPELMEIGFDAAYGWEFHHLLNDIAKGDKKLTAIEDYIAKTDTIYASDDILMNFITNHDENSWAGTEYERMGKYVNGFAAITWLMPGMPLIYTGQEAGLNKRLRFFEKDTVNWNDTTLYSFYRKLNALKHRNPALKAGTPAGSLMFSADTVVNTVTLLRVSGNNKVLGVFNFSDKPANVKITAKEAVDNYTNAMNGATYNIKRNTSVALEPWEFVVLER